MNRELRNTNAVVFVTGDQVFAFEFLYLHHFVGHVPNIPINLSAFYQPVHADLFFNFHFLNLCST